MRKNIILVFLSSIFWWSCEEHSKNKNFESIITTYFDHFNKHDWKAFAQMYTSDAEFKDPTFDMKLTHLSESDIIDKYTNLSQNIPDVHDSIMHIYSSSDSTATVEFMASGTEPGGGRFKLPICVIFTFRNGKISKDYTYYDTQ